MIEWSSVYVIQKEAANKWLNQTTVVFQDLQRHYTEHGNMEVSGC